MCAITKGSFVNKVIIIPLAISLNIFVPILLKYILLIGSCYLAYEGVEKIAEYLFRLKNKKTINKNSLGQTDTLSEKNKIKSAITTDFILSVEIVIIALSTVADRTLLTQTLTVCIVVFIATVGVYGIVAVIVRMDDIGINLSINLKIKAFFSNIGQLLVQSLPVVIRLLSVVGTIALLIDGFRRNI